MTDLIDQLLADLARTPDQRDKLRRIAKARADVTEVSQRYVETRRRVILEARHDYPRLKWREIAEIFGVSIPRAFEMSTQTNPERTTQ